MESILPWQRSYAASTTEVKMSEHPLTGYYREQHNLSARAQIEAESQKQEYFIGVWQERGKETIQIDVIAVHGDLIIWRPLSWPSIYAHPTHIKVFEACMEKVGKGEGGMKCHTTKS